MLRSSRATFWLPFVLLLTPPAATSASVNVGLISFDTLIPGDINTPGVNVFNFFNFTGDPMSGGFALPPDFPVLSSLTFLNSSLTLQNGGPPLIILLGDLGPGALSPTDPVQFPDTSLFSSAIFSATLSQTNFLLSGGGSFVAGSATITAQLLPSTGPSLVAGGDLAVVSVVSVPDGSSVPEPSTWGLLVIALAMMIGLRKRHLRRMLPALCMAVAVSWLPLHAQQVVALSPAATPAAGQAGVTSVSVTGSGFPTAAMTAANTDVKLEPAVGGAAVFTKATSIATLVGATRRVTFLIPASIAVAIPTPYLVSVSGTATGGGTFSSANKATLTINPAASIFTLTPNTGQTGQTLSVTITGAFTTFLQGATLASFGAGISVGNAAEGAAGPVTVTSATTAIAQLRINAAAAPGLRTVVASTGVQQASFAGFTVTSGGTVTPLPTITDFNPKSAPAGTLVTVTGTGLSLNPQVSLSKQGGGSIAAPIGSSTANGLTFTIPPGAVTGLFSVAIGAASATSAVPLTIVASKDFTISASPATADLIQGQAIAFSVKLDSPNNFRQLAALSVSGVPAGATASFKPQQITAGQTSILTLSAPIAQSIGLSDLTVSAAAIVDGLPISKTSLARVNVIAPSTSFIGRTVVDDALETPIAGVTVTMLGKNGSGGTTGCTGTAIADAAGNFALRNLGAACTGRQLVGFDGLTATAPAGKYAGVNLIYTFSTGQVTTSPVLVHLPRIDNQETFFVRQNDPQDQTYSWKAIPGLAVTVYKGTTFTLPGGGQPNPFPLVAVQVPVDRLPDAKPPVPTMMLVFIVAFQPANSKASQPVAVYYPNTLYDRPGNNMPLLTLDPTRGQMIPYGSGTVNPEGTQVVPDLIPGGGGKRYGIVDFDWHGQMPPPPDPETQPSPSNEGGECTPTPETEKSGRQSPVPTCCGGGCPPAEGDPVDLASGLMVYRAVDLTLRGNLGSIQVRRNYRSTTSRPLLNNRPFGPNTNHNYNHALGMDGSTAPSLIVLINPDNSRVPVFTSSGRNLY